MDSGVGGISVLREAARLLPEEKFVFFGDSAHAPYGVKTTEEVRELTLSAVADADRRYRPKAFVIACNTATTAAVKRMRSLYPGRIIVGIEPALKPAALGAQQENQVAEAEGEPVAAAVRQENHAAEPAGYLTEDAHAMRAMSIRPFESQKRRVLVLATPLTIKEEKFHTLLKKYQDVCDVIPLGCPGLMEYAEGGKLDSPETDAFVKGLIGQYAGNVDAVVLGCTHYPFLRGAIARALELPNGAVYDGGYGTAKNLKRLLKEAGLLRDGEKETGAAAEISENAEMKTGQAFPGQVCEKDGATCTACRTVDDAWLDAHVIFENSLPGAAGEERIALCRKLMK